MPDLLLSSGFLAFARHVGVLAAVEERKIDVDAIVGTSSGAMIGAFLAAGMSAADIGKLVAERPPYAYFGVHARVWTGAFSLGPVVAWLRERLPAEFSGLSRPFAAGVIDMAGRPQLLTAGSLPEAVAASCAIPGVFAPVVVNGERWRDGGVGDRLMVAPWREWRGERRAIAHVVDRMAGRDVEVGMEGLTVIRTPRSGATFFSLGDVPAAIALAKERALAALPVEKTSP